MVKRIITFLLALVMVLGAIPAMPAYATEVEVISAPKETAEAVEATTEAAEVITEATEETVEGITDTVEAAAEQTKTEEDPANNWFVDEYGTYHFNNFDGLKYLLQMLNHSSDPTPNLLSRLRCMQFLYRLPLSLNVSYFALPIFLWINYISFFYPVSLKKLITSYKTLEKFDIIF